MNENDRQPTREELIKFLKLEQIADLCFIYHDRYGLTWSTIWKTVDEALGTNVYESYKKHPY